jgi:phage minor structural protein
MIPILFDQSEKQFTTGGLGFLVDCTRCLTSQERNGVFECEFDYPITGPLYDKIQERSIIYATHDNSGEPQPFDIYARSAPINGLVTFYAHHISYRLSNSVVMPFKATSAADAMAKIQANVVTDRDDDFTFWTDKTTTGEYEIKVPTIVRPTLGGEQGSLLDVYGRGDYEFDKFAVRLYQDKGRETDVEIRYGKNLTNITHKIDDSSSYNAIVPYWIDEQTGDLRTLPEGYLSYDDGTAYIVAIPYPMNQYFETMPSVGDMRQKAQQLLDSSEAWKPSEGFEVNFVQLWQTEEYKNYAPLQRVNLCDTVRVYYPELGVDAVRERVVKTVYNTLLDRYDAITLNELPTTLSGLTQNQINVAVDNTVTPDGLRAQLNLAVQLVRGDLGGHIAIPADSDGLPQMIYIMDSPRKSSAVNVIRLDQHGIAVSSSGISGSWTQIYNMASNTWTFPGLTVNGNLNVTGNLTVTGNISAEGLSTTGSASVGGDLTVTGTIINGGA